MSRTHVWSAINISVVSLFYMLYMNASYPRVGHDYAYFLPRIFDTYLHYRVNGISIQWYTPSFGAGLPAYSNPQHIQFSLIQLLGVFSNPWQASLSAVLIFVSIGYLSTFSLAYRILKLNLFSAHLCALFFVANGFYIQHMAVGHVGFQTFMLIPLLVVFVLDSKLSRIVSAILIGLTASLMLHSAGFYMLIYFVLSINILLPLIYLISAPAEPIAHAVMRLGLGLLIFLAVSLSKLNAVASFLYLFHRIVADTYPVTWLSGLFGMMLQYVGVMLTVPLLLLVDKSPMNFIKLLYTFTGANHGFWELDMSLSPAVWILLVAGVVGFLKNSHRQVAFSRRNYFLILWLFVAFYILISFTLAKGGLYYWLSKLPILMSLHVNPRYGSAGILPVALFGGLIFDRLIVRNFSARITLMTYLGFSAISLASLWAYFELPLEVSYRSFNVTTLEELYNESQEKNETFLVNKIVPNIKDYEVFQAKASNLNIVEPVFGYNLGQYSPQVMAGSPFKTAGDYLNFTNPACLVYPIENNCQPFDRVRIDDRENLKKLLNRQQPDWKISLDQSISNVISVVSLVICFAILSIHAARNRLNLQRS